MIISRHPVSAQRRFEDRYIPEPNSGCWLWIGFAHSYRRGGDRPTIRIQGREVFAHRFSWELHNKRKIPLGMVIRHSCDNTLCVNPGHLLLGTQKDNVRDRDDRKRGRWNKGAANHNCKLNAEIKEVILATPRTYGSQKALARRFNLSIWTVHRVRRDQAGTNL